jgi:hypothetical protein
MVFPQPTFGFGKAYGSYATRTRPHHTQGPARGGDWRLETLPSTLALLASTRASAVKFLRWRFADQIYVNCRVNHGIITFNRPHFQPFGNTDQKYRLGLYDLDS